LSFLSNNEPGGVAQSTARRVGLGGGGGGGGLRLDNNSRDSISNSISNNSRFFKIRPLTAKTAKSTMQSSIKSNLLETAFEAVLSKDLNKLKATLSESESESESDSNHINIVNDRGWSVLHMAARYGWVEGCQYLLSLGADATLKTSEGKTALHIARYF
jgi:ankyrin repeat protein